MVGGGEEFFCSMSSSHDCTNLPEDSQNDVIGGSWGLVTTCSWAYDPVYTGATQKRPVKETIHGVRRQIMSGCYVP